MSNCKCKAKPCDRCGKCSRCCQHATNKKKRPPLNCKCKVIRCPSCDLCSSCCQHGSRRRSTKTLRWNGARSKANKKLLFDLCMLVGVYDVLKKNEKLPQGIRGYMHIIYNFILIKRERKKYHNDGFIIFILLWVNFRI